MNKKEYKKRIAGLFQFKSPKSEKYKSIASTEHILETSAGSDKVSTDENDKMSVSTQRSGSDIAQYGKKRDVIIIGAGLSGECQ